jgi:hypothetical protein
MGAPIHKQVIGVSATAITLQMDTTGVGTTIDFKLVNELPLNRRTFAQLATLVPGVAPQGDEYWHRSETGINRDSLRNYGQWLF